MFLPGKLIALLIRGYQKFWPHPPYCVCGFRPTCSEYARQCFLRFGFFRACRLASQRLRRCDSSHPIFHDAPPEDEGGS